MSLTEFVFSVKLIPAYTAFIAIILGIVSISSNNWTHDQQNNFTSGIFCYDNGTVCEGPTIEQRGVTLGFAILALLVFVASIAILAFSVRREVENFYRLGVYLLDVGVTILVIGLAVYLHGSLTTLQMGWSYWVGIATFGTAVVASAIGRLLMYLME